MTNRITGRSAFVADEGRGRRICSAIRARSIADRPADHPDIGSCWLHEAIVVAMADGYYASGELVACNVRGTGSRQRHGLAVQRGLHLDTDDSDRGQQGRASG